MVLYILLENIAQTILYFSAPLQKRKRKNRTDCAVCKENFDCVQSLQFHILKVHQEDPETFVNEDPFADPSGGEEEQATIPAPKVIKIEDSQGSQRIEFVTTNSEGKILNSSIEGLTDKRIIQPTANSPDSANTTNTDNVQILEDFIINEGSAATNAGGETIILSNEAFTVIPLESDGGIIEPVTTNTIAAKTFRTPESKKERKSLAESLAAAIADDDNLTHFSTEGVEQLSEEDLKWKDNVSKLLDMLVDNTTLNKFGWPDISEETVSIE